MKKFMLVFLAIILFNVGLVSAVCEEGQIDINSASAEELDRLYGIGPVKANAIISTRPFNSVDDLIKVYGIGPVTLNKIKEQGLACVVSEELKNTEDVINSTETAEQNATTENTEKEVPTDEEKSSPLIGNVIKLQPKNIKGKNVNGELAQEDYAIYGFFIFSILLGVLFAIKKYKFNKNEFS